MDKSIYVGFREMEIALRAIIIHENSDIQLLGGGVSEFRALSLHSFPAI